MKAVVKTRREPGNVEYMEVPEPQATEGQVVIEVKAAGICGTDIHIYKSEYVIDPPAILGHEFSGVVAEIGPGVSRVKVGDRVTVNPSAGRLCGQCRYCTMGYPFLCIDRGAVGSVLDGGFARYCGVREGIIFELPETLDFDQGALTEAFACTLQAVFELTEILADDVVVVSGPGPIGLMCLLLARSRGARVVVLGTSNDTVRLALASQLGAELAVDVQSESAQDIIDGLTDGYGADVVLECAGVGASARQCVQLVRKLGRYTQIGLFGEPVPIDLDEITKKQVRFQGSICHSWETWRRTLSFLGQGGADLAPLITDRLPLSRWQEGFEKIANSDGCKILLYPED